MNGGQAAAVRTIPREALCGTRPCMDKPRRSSVYLQGSERASSSSRTNPPSPRRGLRLVPSRPLHTLRRPAAVQLALPVGARRPRNVR